MANTIIKESYFYIDNKRILHAVATEELASKHSVNGKFIKLKIPSNKGYPLVKSENKMVDIAVYSLDEVYINGDVEKGKRISVGIYPEIKNIYRKLSDF